MDLGLFFEWAQVDEHLRGVIRARDRRRRAGQHGPSRKPNGNPSAARTADLVFVVSRDDPRSYAYLKQTLSCESVDVLLDRRNGDRRQARQPATPDRRKGDHRFPLRSSP
jgi:hypothetical protein